MKKKKKFVIGIIICVFLLCILIIININLQNAYKQTGKPITPVVDPKDDGVLNLGGFGVFFEKYDGFLSSSDVAKKLEEVTTVNLPQMYNEIEEMSDELLDKYYQENASIIENDYGIQNKNDFFEFIYTLKDKKQDLNTHYRLDLKKDTFLNNSNKAGYAYVEYEVSYLNDNKIKFSLYTAKNKSKTPTYIISVFK